MPVPSEALGIAWLVFFWGGMSLPLGIPPEKEDPLLARVAPAECLFYASWQGMAQPDPKSANQTEQLLAEPEVRRMFVGVEKLISQQLAAQARRGDPQAAFALDHGLPLGKLLLTRPVAVWLERFKIGPAGSDLAGGLLVNLGENAPDWQTKIERLLEGIPAEQTKTDVAGVTLHHIPPSSPGAPDITWAFKGRYLMIGVGKGSVEGMLSRAAAEPPAWLAQVRKDLPVPRLSTLLFLNVRGSLRAFADADPDGHADLAKILKSSGLDSIASMASVSGLDDSGIASRVLLRTEGPLHGFLKLAEGGSTSAETFHTLPADTFLAAAFRLNWTKFYDTLMDTLKENKILDVQEATQQIAEMEGQLGLRLREDLLPALGDSFSLYVEPGGGGLLSGWTAVFHLDQREKTAAVLKKLETDLLPRLAAQLAPTEGGPDNGKPARPAVTMTMLDGVELHSLSLPQAPLRPTWCLHGDTLVVSLFPQSLQAYLSRKKAGGNRLSDRPEMAAMLKDQPNPLFLSYVDPKPGFEALYPMLLYGIAFGATELQKQGVDFDISLIPSAGAISRHLTPSISVVARTPSGIEIVTRQSMPGGSLSVVGAGGPAMSVALLLPAIQAAREAARRNGQVNKMKQLVLAAHNFHDANSRFPAAYSTDKDGKPLLSWRVHLLPYLEQDELYKQFHLDEPWDSAHNKKLIEKMPAIFVNPTKDAPPGQTYAQAVRGADTVFAAPAGPHPSNLGTRMSQITDGTSNTVVLVEAKDPVVWTKPDDYTYDPKEPAKGLFPFHYGDIVVMAFADGHIQTVNRRLIDPKSLTAIFTKSGGEAVRLDDF